MVNELPPIGVGQTGFIYRSLDRERLGAAELTLGTRTIDLVMPFYNGQGDRAEEISEAEKAPENLVFVSFKHKIVLSGCTFEGTAHNWGGREHGEVRIAALSAVAAGSLGDDYGSIEGLRSSVQGLPTWARRSTISTNDEVTTEGRIRQITITAEARDPVIIGGKFNLELLPYFRVTPPENGERTVSESVLVHTRTSQATSWSDHFSVHRRVQELLAIAYWWPCRITTHSVLRADDYATDMAGGNHGEQWREAYAPNPGRPAVAGRAELARSSLPLFWLDDIGPNGVKKWIDEYDDFGRAIWILAASLYQQHQVIEPVLLQVGTALEALGHHIAGQPKDAKMVGLLEALCGDTDCSLESIIGDRQSATEWCRDFNRVYKGVKHADNPLPNPREAWGLSRSGVNLVRLWLARHLGVDRRRLEDWARSQLR